MRSFAAAVLLLAAACSSQPTGGADGGHDAGRRDANDIQLPDSGDPGSDAGQPGEDASTPDAGGPAIGWCNVQPVQVSVRPNEAATILGQVYVPGLTEPAGQGAGVAAELGVGPTGSDPRASSGWTWTAASYDSDVGNNDQYRATASSATVGDLAYAFRFSIGSREPFYCDTDGNDGSAGGFSPMSLGTLHVGGRKVDWCGLSAAIPASIGLGGKSQVKAQVLVSGVTDSAGQGAQIESEVGVGPSGTDASTAVGGWTWNAATYLGDIAQNDEYSALIAPPLGDWAISYRFRYQGGDWLYCDLDGNNGSAYSASQQGALAVNPPWVGLKPLVSALELGGSQILVTGEIYSGALTDAAGQGTGVTAEVGYGPSGSDASGSGWTWTAASYREDSGNGSPPANDLYGGWIALPTTGSVDIAMRFHVAGQTFLADLDGSTNGYQPAQNAQVAVAAAGTDLNWCDLQYPASTTAAVGANSPTIYGQIYISGVTPNPGADTRVVAQLGFGPEGGAASSDPRTDKWIWIPASYNSTCTTCGANNDEYSAVIKAPATAGTYRYAYRFRFLQGWVYCGKNGSLDGVGFAPAEAGTLTIQ